MNKLLSRIDLPSFALLFSYLTYIIIKNNPSIADGLIVIALSSIYAYHQYLIQKEKPDYDKQIADLRVDMIKDVTKLRDDFSKFQMVQNRVTPLPTQQKIRF